MELKQYQIVLVNLDPTIGSEMKKTRPCVIISPDEMNKYLQTIVIAPMLVVMRHNDGHKYIGLTENCISVDNSLFLNLDKQFFCFLLSSPHFGFDKPALANTNLAHLLLPCRQADANAKSKELNFLTRKIIVLNKFFDYFFGNKNKSTKTIAFFTFASCNSYNP